MGYVVKRGVLLMDGVAYEAGEHVPAMKGELSAQVQAGAVEWVQSAGEDRSDEGLYAGMTKAELIAECEERELDVPSRAKVAELVALLEADDAEGDEPGDDDDAGDDDNNEDNDGEEPSEDGE